MSPQIKFLTLAIIVALTLTYQNVMAAGGGETRSWKSTSAPSDFAKGEKALKADNYQSAVRYLSKEVKKKLNNADAQNLLGFSYRKLGETDKAFEHYNQALRLDPKHRGANEYLGELYLETGQFPQAEERLEVLAKACSQGCEEYGELKEAIEKYKANSN